MDAAAFNSASKTGRMSDLMQLARYRSRCSPVRRAGRLYAVRRRTSTVNCSYMPYLPSEATSWSHIRQDMRGSNRQGGNYKAAEPNPLHTFFCTLSYVGLGTCLMAAVAWNSWSSLWSTPDMLPVGSAATATEFQRTSYDAARPHNPPAAASPSSSSWLRLLHPFHLPSTVLDFVIPTPALEDYSAFIRGQDPAVRAPERKTPPPTPAVLTRLPPSSSAETSQQGTVAAPASFAPDAQNLELQLVAVTLGPALGVLCLLGTLKLLADALSAALAVCLSPVEPIPNSRLLRKRDGKNTTNPALSVSTFSFPVAPSVVHDAIQYGLGLSHYSYSDFAESATAKKPTNRATAAAVSACPASSSGTPPVTPDVMASTTAATSANPVRIRESGNRDEQMLDDHEQLLGSWTRRADKLSTTASRKSTELNTVDAHEAVDTDWKGSKGGHPTAVQPDMFTLFDADAAVDAGRKGMGKHSMQDVVSFVKEQSQSPAAQPAEYTAHATWPEVSSPLLTAAQLNTDTLCKAGARADHIHASDLLSHTHVAAAAANTDAGRKLGGGADNVPVSDLPRHSIVAVGDVAGEGSRGKPAEDAVNLRGYVAAVKCSQVGVFEMPGAAAAAAVAVAAAHKLQQDKFAEATLMRLASQQQAGSVADSASCTPTMADIGASQQQAGSVADSASCTPTMADIGASLNGTVTSGVSSPRCDPASPARSNAGVGDTRGPAFEPTLTVANSISASDDVAAKISHQLPDTANNCCDLPISNEPSWAYKEATSPENMALIYKEIRECARSLCTPQRDPVSPAQNDAGVWGTQGPTVEPTLPVADSSSASDDVAARIPHQLPDTADKCCDAPLTPGGTNEPSWAYKEATSPENMALIYKEIQEFARSLRSPQCDPALPAQSSPGVWGTHGPAFEPTLPVADRSSASNDVATRISHQLPDLADDCCDPPTTNEPSWPYKEATSAENMAFIYKEIQKGMAGVNAAADVDDPYRKRHQPRFQVAADGSGDGLSSEGHVASFQLREAADHGGVISEAQVTPLHAPEDANNGAVISKARVAPVHVGEDTNERGLFTEGHDTPFHVGTDTSDGTPFPEGQLPPFWPQTDVTPDQVLLPSTAAVLAAVVGTFPKIRAPSTEEHMAQAGGGQSGGVMNRTGFAGHQTMGASVQQGGRNGAQGIGSDDGSGSDWSGARSVELTECLVARQGAEDADTDSSIDAHLLEVLQSAGNWSTALSLVRQPALANYVRNPFALLYVLERIQAPDASNGAAERARFDEFLDEVLRHMLDIVGLDGPGWGPWMLIPYLEDVYSSLQRLCYPLPGRVLPALVERVLQSCLRHVSQGNDLSKWGEVMTPKEVATCVIYAGRCRLVLTPREHRAWSSIFLDALHSTSLELQPDTSAEVLIGMYQLGIRLDDSPGWIGPDRRCHLSTLYLSAMFHACDLCEASDPLAIKVLSCMPLLALANPQVPLQDKVLVMYWRALRKHAPHMKVEETMAISQNMLSVRMQRGRSNT